MRNKQRKRGEITKTDRQTDKKKRRRRNIQTGKGRISLTNKQKDIKKTKAKKRKLKVQYLG